MRRRVADAIHDGPVQELVGLDMILSAAGSAARSGQARESIEHIEEARELATKNIRALRDEIVDLGPFAFEELTFDPAIRDLHPGLEAPLRFEVMVAIERVVLPGELAGDCSGLPRKRC